MKRDKTETGVKKKKKSDNKKKAEKEEVSVWLLMNQNTEESSEK